MFAIIHYQSKLFWTLILFPNSGGIKGEGAGIIWTSDGEICKKSGWNPSWCFTGTVWSTISKLLQPWISGAATDGMGIGNRCLDPLHQMAKKRGKGRGRGQNPPFPYITVNSQLFVTIFRYIQNSYWICCLYGLPTISISL